MAKTETAVTAENRHSHRKREQSPNEAMAPEAQLTPAKYPTPENTNSSLQG